jgi:hypothetical protein
VVAKGAFIQRPAISKRDDRSRRIVHDRLVEGWTPRQVGWLKCGEERCRAA